MVNKKTPSVQNIALNFIQTKNNKNFSELIKRLKPGLLNFAYNYVKDVDLAKEVVSQTFIIIWEKIEQYNPKYNFSTWAYAIAKNEALGIIKNRNKYLLFFDKYIDGHSRLLHQYDLIFNMDDEVVGDTGEDLVQKLYDASILAINNLKEPYKSVMIEREINQKQLADIANDLNMNLSTVKTRLRKGRKDVAEILCKKFPEEVDTYFSGNDNEKS